MGAPHPPDLDRLDRRDHGDLHAPAESARVLDDARRGGVPRRLLEAAALTFDRYVAIGDSTSEGLDDPDGQGGYRGWADRLAERIARSQAEPLLYANLAVRG